MTIRHLLDQAVTGNPGGTALRFRRNTQWRERTYAQCGQGVREMSEAFAGLGLVPQGAPVALMLENGPEWMEAYLAASATGMVTVPIDPKLRASEVRHILDDSGAAVIVTDRSHGLLLEEIVGALPQLRHVVVTDAVADAGMEGMAPIEGIPCHAYEALRREATAQGALRWFDAHVPAADDVASIIYTSGTTGKPKGAMLTHGNFHADAAGSLDRIGIPITPEDDFLIVLPLFHSFSFTTNFVIPISRGATMSFVENLRTVADDLRTLRCTILMAVPLLAEKMYTKIDARIRTNPAARLMLRTGLGHIVGRKIMETLGGRLRIIVIGGAPCPVQVLKGFKKLGIPVVEGYGLTECSPVVSLNAVGKAKIGTIGLPLPNIAVRIADPNEQGVGELQVKGPITMKGYFKNAAATAEALDAGWCGTGDLASIDGDGFITIRGRKKALIVNREGKNIYPEEVENAIADDMFIHDVVVIGYTVGDDKGERVG
ncbi:MAG: AMP-binding protein, partial [Kiritimatiellaeota bacterium]|nr:AMP-binding protein [Kiritimatiellota bacterium]